jgi:hypothetical protein
MSAPIVVGHDPHGADDAPMQFGIAAARFADAPLIVVAVHGGRLDHRYAHTELGVAADDEFDGVRARLEREPDVESELRAVEAHRAARGLADALEEVGLSSCSSFTMAPPCVVPIALDGDGGAAEYRPMLRDGDMRRILRIG